MNTRLHELLILLTILLPGLMFRILVAPYTSGSDIPQFAGFADTFLRHGLCFYNYSDGSRFYEEDWPYGWPYVYGPGLVLLLAPLRLLAPTPVKHFWNRSTYYVYVSMDWIIACKSLFILFDTLTAMIIYYYARRIHYSKALLAVILYYYNPMTIYISSIYGMFDQIALALYLLGAYLYMYASKISIRYTGLFLTGLSIAVKQTMIYPLIILTLLIIFMKEKIKMRILGILVVLTGIALLFIPFFTYCPESINVFIKALRSVTKPGYTVPVVYSFNGISSLATILHECCSKNTLFLIENWYILFTILFILVVLGHLYSRNILEYMGYAYIVYTATYWRVNHQYLVPTVAFAILILLVTRRKPVKILSIILIILIALWPVMFPTSWWAHAHIENPNKDIIYLLDNLSLMIFEDTIYVLYSLTLTITQILLILHGTLDDAYNAVIAVFRYSISKATQLKSKIIM